MTPMEMHGPIDFVLIEFPRERLGSEVAQALSDLIKRGVIRLYDLAVISKNDDDSFDTLEVSEVGGLVGEFSSFAGATSGLLDDEDLREAARAMTPNTVGALIVYENTWAIPFVAAARSSGGELIASARIPATDVMDALDALESVDATT